MSAGMKFEFLPNEIIITFFEYLNGPDLFNAFDQLNQRFQILIRNIPLFLNCQHIKKRTFDQFCNRMLLNSEIKSQIYSLRLSNEYDTCGQITEFLSLFSLDEFDHLRSLTLVFIEENELERLPSMLSSLSNLYYFCCDTWRMNNQILVALPLLNLRKLKTFSLFQCSIITQKTTLITHLTIFECVLDDIYKFFKYAPMLKYLNVGYVADDNCFSLNEVCLANMQAICLTYLNLRFNGRDREFDRIEKLIKQTPNLEILTLSNVFCIMCSATIDAARWQNLISLFLPHLRIFKFDFDVSVRDKNVTERDSFIEKFQRFQTDFWHQQHHWYTACILDNWKASIFTIPYIGRECIIRSPINLHYSASITNSKFFDHATSLTLYPEAITEYSYDRFSNVTSLELGNEDNPCDKFVSSLSETNVIKFFTMIVNLTNLKHLDIRRNSGMESPTILLQLLKETSQLSSISISIINLMLLLDNDELCKYLNKMIKKLDIRFYSDSLIVSHQLERVWTIFSNLEQLTCCISSQNDLLVIFNRLPKLLNLSIVDCRTCFEENINFWLQNNVPELNKNFLLDVIGDRQLFMWIGR